MPRRQTLTLAALVLVCLGVGAVGGLTTSASVRDWYPTLARPDWTPPDWVFGPVWTTLYVLIGAAGWLVAPTAFAPHSRSWTLWWIQLLLNALWSPLFFGAQLIGLAMVNLGLLWVSVAAFVRSSWRSHRWAAVLFLPYWAWVSFALALNVAIWRLNG